jgi:O-antigen/teichoic acid export membrane protein
VASGIAQLAGSRAITFGIQFVTLALIARALGPSGYGLLQFGLAAFVYVGLSNDVGLTVLGAREHDTAEALSRTRASLIGARLVLTAVVVLIMVPAVLVIPLSSEGRLVAAILIVGFIFSAVNLRWRMQADERFGAIAIADTIGACVQLAITLAFVRGPGDLAWAAVAAIAMPVTGTMVLLFLARRRSGLSVEISRRSARLLRRAAPLGVALLATAVYYSSDSVLLGLFRGSDEVGYYSAAYRIVLSCMLIPVVVHSVILPIGARLSRTDGVGLADMVSRSSRGLIWIALPLAIGTTLTAGTIISLVYGPAFAPSGLPLSILIWSCVTVSANVPFAVLMLARNQDRVYMGVTVAGAVINLALNLVLIPVFGMIGAAATTIVSEITVLAAILWYTRDMSTMVLARSVRIALPAAGCLAIALFVVGDRPIAFLVGPLVYLGASLATKAITTDELRTLGRDIQGRPGQPPTHPIT